MSTDDRLGGRDHPQAQWWSRSQHPREVAEACRYLIEHDATRSLTRSIALEVLGQHLPQQWDLTGRHVPQALHEWARHRLRFVREPRVEWVADLEHTFRRGAGDCDDLTVAIGTIAHSVGVPTWVCWRWTGPAYAHVYCGLGPSWLPGGLSMAQPTWNVDPFLPALTTAMGPPGQVHLLPCGTRSQADLGRLG